MDRAKVLRTAAQGNGMDSTMPATVTTKASRGESRASVIKKNDLPAVLNTNRTNVLSHT